MEHDISQLTFEETLTSSDLPELNKLLPQLSSKLQLTSSQLDTILQSSCIKFSVIRDESKKLIGVASLIFSDTMHGRVGHVEDVVVNGEYRGLGLGKKIIQNLIDLARALNIKHLDLTSKPDRETANALYQKLGFQKRDTNVYRLKLENSPLQNS